jgi:hypothetical protein
MATNLRISVLLACCASLALASGCGKKEKSVSTPDGKVTVTQQGSGATMEVTTKDGKATVTANEKGVALPANFPNDVPIMGGATVTMAMESGGNLSVHLRTTAPVAEAATFYENGLRAQGWEIEATMKMGDSTMVAAKKGKRDCAVTVAKDSGGSIVQLTVPREGG